VLTKDSSSGRLDFRSDVLPLVDGEVAIGTFGATTRAQYLMLVHSSDPEKLLRLFAASDQVPDPSDRIQGALYYENVHGAVVAASSSGWVVSGPSRSVVEQALASALGRRTASARATDTCRWSTACRRIGLASCSWTHSH
jgi:hypothetical protein